MPTALPCTCCAREGTLRCSGCWKVGLVVPFCSVEHQKMLWCTHKAICGRIQEGRPYMPPYTREEYLMYSMVELTSYDEMEHGGDNVTEMMIAPGSGFCRLNKIAPAENRPLRVPGNVLDKVDDLPPVFLSAFKADWTAAVQHLADVATTETGKHHNVPTCRLTILQTSELRPTILPPPVHPSVLPYILISEALLQVLRHEEVTQGNNIIPYVNSMVVFATVLAHFLRAPHTSPLDHWKQLRILLFRVEDEARKVVERGPVEGPNEEGTTIHIVQSTVKPKSCINWSWFFLTREVKRLMDFGWEYKALR